LGPLAKTAGHDINYLAIAGVLSLFGRVGEKPLFPGNLLADFAGGGMLCALGIVIALFERARSGQGQVIDAAMIDGVAYLSTFVHKLRNSGLWSSPRGTNLLDSGAPFYDTYRTKDGSYMAVGALEPQFYAQLLEGLGLAGRDLPQQMDASGWPVLRSIFQESFASKTQSEWTRVFNGTDACVTPVVEFSDAAGHEHNRARGAMVRNDAEGGELEPLPAPRLSRTPAWGEHRPQPPSPGHSTRVVLMEFGFSEQELSQLAAQGTIEGDSLPLPSAL